MLSHLISKCFVRTGLVLGCAVAVLAPLQSHAGVGHIAKGDLFGKWVVALSGVTGCGATAMLANATMDANGVGTATLTMHGACGDSVLTNQNFSVLSLNPSTGTGTIGLSCGASCGWILSFQVSPDRGVMNLVDVEPANPGNYIAGLAVHQ